jgi:hypothetical protein
MAARIIFSRELLAFAGLLIRSRLQTPLYREALGHELRGGDENAKYFASSRHTRVIT